MWGGLTVCPRRSSRVFAGVSISVHAKIALLVIALGACACTLLAMRQSRLQVASELTQTQLRINAADERLWQLRARIGSEVAPERVEELAAGLGALRPLAEAPLPPVIEPAPAKSSTKVAPVETSTAKAAEAKKSTQSSAVKPKPKASPKPEKSKTGSAKPQSSRER